MNFYIHQSIFIQQIKITAVTNSSVFQIGTAGMIKALSNLNNTGGYSKTLAEPMHAPGQVIQATSSL